jgi:ATP-dependent RNA helicase DDX49/DBP8
MPSRKLPAAVAVQHDESGEGSGSDSDQSSIRSGNYSESDSLDDLGSRKRIRISPVPAIDDEDDDEDVPLPQTKLSAPTSRIKSRAPKPSTPKIISEEDYIPPPTTAITAPLDPNTTFGNLGVKPWLVNSLKSMAIKRPTGIQKGCIPEIIKGRDCIGGSRTGSGKTVAFAVPILQCWAQDPFGIYAVILTPTR